MTTLGVGGLGVGAGMNTGMIPNQGYNDRMAAINANINKNVMAAQTSIDEQKKTEADVKELVATWDKQLQDAQSSNDVKVAGVLGAAGEYDLKTRAVADAEYETLVADGNLAVAKAEALRDELRNAALDSVGGRILQARDAAENLNFTSVTLNSNDPNIPSVIDIDALVDILVGSKDE